jgi:hypothetical protein
MPLLTAKRKRVVTGTDPATTRLTACCVLLED